MEKLNQRHKNASWESTCGHRLPISQYSGYMLIHVDAVGCFFHWRCRVYQSQLPWIHMQRQSQWAYGKDVAKALVFRPSGERVDLIS